MNVAEYEIYCTEFQLSFKKKILDAFAKQKNGRKGERVVLLPTINEIIEKAFNEEIHDENVEYKCSTIQACFLRKSKKRSDNSERAISLKRATKLVHEIMIDDLKIDHND